MIIDANPHSLGKKDFDGRHRSAGTCHVGHAGFACISNHTHRHPIAGAVGLAVSLWNGLRSGLSWCRFGRCRWYGLWRRRIPIAKSLLPSVKRRRIETFAPTKLGDTETTTRPQANGQLPKSFRLRRTSLLAIHVGPPENRSPHDFTISDHARCSSQDGHYYSSLLMFSKVMQRRFDVFSAKPSFRWAPLLRYESEGQ